MYDKIPIKIKPILKSLLVIGLIFTIILGDASSALAARSGGRIGGGGFRTPRTTAPAPRGGYYPGPGGGIGFPFLFPFFGIGGFGSLFSILVFFAIANFIIRSFRSGAMTAGSENSPAYYGNQRVSVAQVQVGLLADARNLQQELTELAKTADTGTPTGRALVLQEATLALLRHPEYWVYAAADSQYAPLEAAEARFNQLALAERSKFTEETLSNVNSQLRQATATELNSEERVPGEYIAVTIIAGVEGTLQLPTINDTETLRQALRQLGSMGSDRLLAVEVLWTPQAEGDTLSADDLLTGYPNLKLL